MYSNIKDLKYVIIILITGMAANLPTVPGYPASGGAGMPPPPQTGAPPQTQMPPLQQVPTADGSVPPSSDQVIPPPQQPPQAPVPQSPPGQQAELISFD